MAASSTTLPWETESFAILCRELSSCRVTGSSVAVSRLARDTCAAACASRATRVAASAARKLLEPLRPASRCSLGLLHSGLRRGLLLALPGCLPCSAACAGALCATTDKPLRLLCASRHLIHFLLPRWLGGGLAHQCAQISRFPSDAVLESASRSELLFRSAMPARIAACERCS